VPNRFFAIVQSGDRSECWIAPLLAAATTLSDALYKASCAVVRNGHFGGVTVE
jgi:hypothetical protein